MSETSEQSPELERAIRSPVLPFSRDMIRKYLEAQGLSYLKDPVGDFRVDFAYDDELDCAVSFWLMAAGQHGEIFGLEARSTKRFGRDSWDWVLYVVNEWNRRMRYPKAYFWVTNPESDQTGEIRLEQYIDLEKGIHQELFDSLVYTMMAGATRFWSWQKEQSLHRHMALASDDKLDG